MGILPVIKQLARRVPSALLAGGIAFGLGAAHAAEPAGGGGLPQLNPETFPTQLFWGAVAFVTLYILMSKVALPRVAAVIEERGERIGEDLDKAAQLNAEAEAAHAQYEKALADARTDAVMLLREMEAGLAQANAEAQAAVAAEIAAQGEAAESRIAAAKQAALQDLRTVAIEVAESVTARLTGDAADHGRIETAVDSAMQERR
ncbi:F-type H+-transporting ATPase subunit b [Constrictibacter sp. MBR-5]|jgi:F-type H+-transporting ATPase subunit b